MSDTTKYTHAEAFCLMWYGCPCGHRERIWNSRDGVTPFGMTCPSCGTSNMRHINWSLDDAVPNHKLHHRQKFWRNGTPEEAKAVMRERLDQCKGTNFEVTDPAKIEQIIASATDDQHGEFQPGWPMLDIAP